MKIYISRSFTQPEGGHIQYEDEPSVVHSNDPLFIDPYATCLLSPDIGYGGVKDEGASLHAPSLYYYRLATKFIDQKLANLMDDMDELRQVVLLTDGMDTRPFRLNWPRLSIIYDISPGNVFKTSSKRLQEFGAKMARTCMLVHVPWESPDLLTSLCFKGFNGNKPSIWVLQGLPVMSITSLHDILYLVSSLAMKGCNFMGELPLSLMQTEHTDTSSASRWMEKVFMSHGFRVDEVKYDVFAKALHQELPVGDLKSALFLAEQLRLSDAQMERWRAEFYRMEEEADEEGFEEL